MKKNRNQPKKSQTVSKGEQVIIHGLKRINTGGVQRYTAGRRPFISGESRARRQREAAAAAAAEHIFSPVKHLGGSAMIAARMAASGPGPVGSTDVTDNGSQMNSEAYRKILSALSHVIKEVGGKGGKCGRSQFDNLKTFSISVEPPLL